MESPADAPGALMRLIEHAAHLLPSQGPLSVFVHHNTLHAFEDEPFDRALLRAHELYRCEVYLPEARYRRELARGRIRLDDLKDALHDDLGERADDLIGFLGTRFSLRLAMLQFPLYSASHAELAWVIAETEALREFRRDAPAEARDRAVLATRRWVMRDFLGAPRTGASDRVAAPIEAMIADVVATLGEGGAEDWPPATWEEFTLQLLWRLCSQGVAAGLRPADQLTWRRRHRDVLLDAARHDCDELVHDVLIRLCAAFLDQGMAHWPLPDREQGFYRAVLNLYADGGVMPAWLRDARPEFQRLLRDDVSPLDSIEESLAVLGVEPDERESFLVATLLALGGWAGMFWQMETNAEWTARPAPRGSLVEFLAVRLLLDRFAVARVARDELHYHGPLQEVRAVAQQQTPGDAADGPRRRVFLIFQLAQALGWKPEDLHRLTGGTWRRLVDEIDEFSELHRRRVFQRAYERGYRSQSLDALAAFNRRPYGGADAAAETPPLFQVVCCIDEREESFRRHLEECEPRCETFGYAGFFGVAMYYRGAAEAHARPLCPIVIKPTHFVEELPVFSFADEHVRRARLRRRLGDAAHRIHRTSRSLVGGALTALFGSLASIPLVARILFPRTAAQFRRLLGRFVEPPPVTHLLLERTAADPGPDEGHVGYTVAEMAAIVERVLRDIGLTSRFARVIIVCGHGSSSLNNPHESAYDCGACGGGRGGPNARAFSQMANDPRVREILAGRGLPVPPDVVFVGAMHNTCDDGVAYFDLDRLPPSHRDAFEQARRAIDQARLRNAHERCRRFESAPLSLTPELALRHVQGRAADLAQVRPECGHATNAVCFVGRRARTRGMFLDRRWFLTSYDPAQDDPDRAILTRILQAVIPVCAGINLEYYFSYVDSRGWGCGTKLPHNITALLGVMDGAASDLRPGLPWQMVEIHEPIRILFIVETTPQAMREILDRHPALARLVGNDWVQLATIDPESARIDLFQGGEFRRYAPRAASLPEVAASADWYRGWRDHLGYAVVSQRSLPPSREGLPA